MACLLPQAFQHTLAHYRNCQWPVPRGLAAKWFPGATLPLNLSVKLVVDGQARLPAVKGQIKQTKGNLYLATQAAKSLAVGSKVLRYKRPGPDSLEVHATEP